MITKYVLSIDPGVSSGIALGKFSNSQPYTLIQGWQFTGGVKGLIEWVNNHFSDGIFQGFSLHLNHIICEKFTPLQGKGFSLTMNSVEPLRGEGALIALKVMPDYCPGSKVWPRPAQMYFCGGNSLPEKKKLSRQFLKDSGNYLKPKQLGEPDSDDFMSATLHGIAYVMKTLGHQPTFDMVTDWERSRK